MRCEIWEFWRVKISNLLVWRCSDCTSILFLDWTVWDGLYCIVNCAGMILLSWGDKMFAKFIGRRWHEVALLVKLYCQTTTRFASILRHALFIVAASIVIVSGVERLVRKCNPQYIPILLTVFCAIMSVVAVIMNCHRELSSWGGKMFAKFIGRWWHGVALLVKLYCQTTARFASKLWHGMLANYGTLC